MAASAEAHQVLMSTVRSAADSGDSARGPQHLVVIHQVTRRLLGLIGSRCSGIREGTMSCTGHHRFLSIEPDRRVAVV